MSQFHYIFVTERFISASVAVLLLLSLSLYVGLPSAESSISTVNLGGTVWQGGRVSLKFTSLKELSALTGTRLLQQKGFSVAGKRLLLLITVWDGV